MTHARPLRMIAAATQGHAQAAVMDSQMSSLLLMLPYILRDVLHCYSAANSKLRHPSITNNVYLSVTARTIDSLANQTMVHNDGVCCDD